jgi:PDZ domain-containing secreted protein
VAAVQAKKPGDVVILTITRSGENAAKEVEVTLGENPDKDGAGYMGVRIMEINQQITPQDLPSWLDKILPKGFQLPVPPATETPSESGA